MCPCLMDKTWSFFNKKATLLFEKIVVGWFSMPKSLNLMTLTIKCLSFSFQRFSSMQADRNNRSILHKLRRFRWIAGEDIVGQDVLLILVDGDTTC